MSLLLPSSYSQVMRDRDLCNDAKNITALPDAIGFFPVWRYMSRLRSSPFSVILCLMISRGDGCGWPSIRRWGYFVRRSSASILMMITCSVGFAMFGCYWRFIAVKYNKTLVDNMSTRVLSLLLFLEFNNSIGSAHPTFPHH